MTETPNPYLPPQAETERPSAAADLPILKSWGVFFLISTLGGGILGAVIGGILGVVLTAVGLGGESLPLVVGGITFLLSIPFSYVVFRWVVLKILLRPPVPHP